MENERTDSVWKTVLLVFGIIFSIVLVPGLILGIPVGGVITSLTSATSRESIQTMTKEANLSETIYEMLMDEILSEDNKIDDIKQEFWEEIVRDSITVEKVDEIVTVLIDSAYSGTKPEIKLSEIVAGLRKGLDELRKNGFHDLYSAWADGTDSKYFSAEFVQSFRTEIEDGLLSDYADYGAASVEELKSLYEKQNGAGSFSQLLDEYADEFDDVWESEFADEFDKMFDEMTDDMDREFNETVYEAIQDPDVRMVFDSLNEISKKSSTVKFVIYAILLGAVLLLLVCYWFGTAGFVVPAVALILGGILCKLLILSERYILNQVNQAIAEEPGLEGMTQPVFDIARGILAPIFDGISRFGTITIGMGVLLVLLAILKGVLKKNVVTADQ